MIYILLFLFSLLPCLPALDQKKNDLELVGVCKTDNKCNYTLISPRKVINPYRSAINNFVPQKPFGSFYLKCAACLAVANQISKIIESIVQQLEKGQKRPHSASRSASKEINELCVQGFKNYDLRKCKEFSFITDNYKCTQHVKSPMDGGWTKKLRELCNLYTAHMDLEHISDIYANKTEELSTHLCKNAGIFRDCLHLELNLPRSSKEICNC